LKAKRGAMGGKRGVNFLGDKRERGIGERENFRVRR